MISAMPSITNKQRILILIMGLFLLILDVIIIFPRTIQSYKSGNFTEIISTTKDDALFIISTASFFISCVAIIITLNSMKIANESLKETKTSNENTEEALRLTEIEQQIRDIEKRLDLFYFPMQDYFKIATGRRTKGGLTDSDRIDRIHAEAYRYLANDDTRKKLEIWLIATEDKAIKQKLLINAIKADIEKYQKDLAKHVNDRKALLDYKAIETPVEKKK